jgi:photosystem II stability/assembly factor-like uncharacterized protein
MPTIITRGAMSARAFGFGASAAAGGNFTWAVAAGYSSAVNYNVSAISGNYSIVSENTTYTNLKSSDNGATSSTITGTSAAAFSMDITATGQYQLFAASSTPQGIYQSNNFGATFSVAFAIPSIYGLKVASYSNQAIAARYGGYCYLSTDYGLTWSVGPIFGNWFAAGVSDNGTYMLIGDDNGGIYKSSNSGSSFTAVGSLGASTVPRRLSISNDGNTIYAFASERVFKSTNGGTNFSTISAPIPSGQLLAGDVAFLVGGDRLIVGGSNKSIFISNDGGASWKTSTATLGGNSISLLSFESLSLSPDGTKAIAAQSGTRGVFIGTYVP